jgi:hypothetical protein
MGGTSITTPIDSLVTQWDDEIGTNHLLDYANSENPIYNANRDINGNECIQFNSTGGYKYLLVEDGLIGGAGNDYTIAIVFESAGAANGYLLNVTDGNAIGNPAILTVSGNLDFYAGAQIHIGTIVETTGYHNVVITYDSSADHVNVWLDGARVITDDTTGADSSGEDTFIVGDVWHGYQNFVGNIGEIIIYDTAADATTAGQIDTYFSRWD